MLLAPALEEAKNSVKKVLIRRYLSVASKQAPHQSHFAFESLSTKLKLQSDMTIR